jgi:phosphate transport system protein
MNKQPTDKEYAAELAKVRENLLKMAGCVEQMITDATRALVELDNELATATIARDLRVNRLEVDTDELCLLILAKRHPVASDLRFITLAMKMVTDLERIGDLAVNIGERVLSLDAAPTPAAGDKFLRMAEVARGMVVDAIDAFVTRDVAKAETIFNRDDQIDDLYREVSRGAEGEMAHDPAHLQRHIHWTACAKFIERVGDHATNLAELAVFLVKGKDIRHLGKLEPR